MNKSVPLQRLLLRSLLVGALLALSGCALVPQEPPPPEPIAEPEPVVAPAPPVEAPPAAVPEPVAETPPQPVPVTARVAIVLSDSLPAYASVAAGLARHLDDFESYDLSDRNRSPQQVFAAIADSRTEFVVAIGMHAAKFARSYATVPVVFSQVFNVNDSGLVSDTTRGVAMLPPLDLQAEAWRGMDPKVRNVGAILGAGHDDLVAEAEQAMAKHGITLQHATAHSDRETLYHFRRLVRGIDGFLLFPDNRILSRAVFSEIMADAARHHVQVAVFNESLLKHGATFSASAVDSNIADTITIVLNAFEAGKIDDVAAVTPLTGIRIRVNPAMVRIFGLITDGVEIDNSVADVQ